MSVVSLHIESTDSMIRRTRNTCQYKKISPNLRNGTLITFITTYRSSSSVFMTNKTPRVAKTRCESTTPGTRKTGELFFFLSFFFFFRQLSSTLPQSVTIVFARNSSIFNRAVQRPIAFSLPPSLHQAAAAAHYDFVCHAIFTFVRMRT